jgi:hypothetical protein
VVNLGIRRVEEGHDIHPVMPFLRDHILAGDEKDLLLGRWAVPLSPHHAVGDLV